MIGAILLGLFVGIVGRMLVPRDAFRGFSGPVSWLISLGLGLLGALVGVRDLHARARDRRRRHLRLGRRGGGAIIGVIIVILIATPILRRIGKRRRPPRRRRPRRRRQRRASRGGDKGPRSGRRPPPAAPQARQVDIPRGADVASSRPG